MEWVRDETADASGTHLQGVLPGLDVRKLEAAVGRPGRGYDDPEKGYESQYTFRVPGTHRVATLYDRWGVWRVGARDPDTAADLVAWLRVKTGGAL